MKEDLFSLSAAELFSLVPFPADNAHKYSRGKLIVAAGCERYCGAASLAARAANRMGAGYVRVFCDDAALLPVRLANPSLVVSSWNELADDEGCFRELPQNVPARPCACLVGSGFDAQDSFQRELTLRMLRLARMPVCVDGGGIHALRDCEALEILRQRKAAGFSTVITPHAGEAQALARSAGIENADKCTSSDLARLLARAYDAVVVAKGPVSFIDDGQRCLRMDQGTPALSKAGTGDVLAGMTAALLAQGVKPFSACVLADYLHAFAGKEAEARETSLCVCAEDLPDYIPAAIDRLRRFAHEQSAFTSDG